MANSLQGSLCLDSFVNHNCLWICGNMKPDHSNGCSFMRCSVMCPNLYVCVYGSGGDGSCPGGDPSWSPVGRQPPLCPGTHHPALQWAATSLWHHHDCHTHQAGLAQPSTRPAAPPWRGENADTHTKRLTHMFILTKQACNATKLYPHLKFKFPHMKYFIKLNDLCNVV